jgi:hypothetical protein
VIANYRSIASNHNKISDSLDKENENLNAYYCPELFTVVEKYLYLLPFLLNENKLDNDKKITRLSNNPVENWFNRLKNFLLLKRTVMPNL